MFQPSLTRRCLVGLALFPALKDRAKFKHRYAAKAGTRPYFLSRTFWAKPVQALACPDKKDSLEAEL
jgi:hypothetical protein